MFLSRRRRESVCSNGFTIIELMVVISIIGLLASAIIADYAGQRIPRNLTIGQNEMVTNIRQMQSYALSSHTVSGVTPQFYLVRFNLSTPTSYDLVAITSASTPPAQVTTVQTIRLPQFVKITGISINNVAITNGCALAAFKLPFSKVIMEDGCSLPSNPSVSSGDDYDKIISFVNNGANSAVTDQPMQITLGNTINNLTKNVYINGFSGLVNFQ